MPYPTSLIRRFLSSCRTSIVEMRQPNVGISHSLKMFSGNSFVTGTMLVGSAERIAILTWLVVALAVAQLTYGQTYTITSMPAWSAASGAVSLPTGINNTGQIVGYYYSGSTQLPVGFLFDRASKAYTSLAYPGATETWATAVNDSGVVVGYYTTDPPSTVNSVHAFSYSQGAFANIDPSASSSAFVYGIDNTGDYVGLFLPASQSNYVGFISVAGSVSVLAPPAGFGDAFPRGINNLGQIVGYMYPSSSTSEGLKCTSQCGFLLNGAQYEILKGESSSIFVEAAAINDYGEVVGYTEADSLYDPYIGFVFYGGSYVASPNAACAGSTYLRGINNSGEIVGYCLDGESFGFLATPSVSPSSISKQLGQCGCSWNLGEPQKGDPITLGNGNLFEQAEDYRTSGTNPLVFARYYNSLSSSSNPPTFATTLGTNWRSNYDRYLRLITTGGTITGVIVERPDGKALNFTLNGSVWTSDTDVDIKLTESGSTWTLADHDDTVETYAVNSAGEGLLQAIQARNGYTQTLAYNSSNQLQSVTDTYGRSLNLTFSGGLLETVTTPDNLVLTYGMTAVTGGNQLTSVSYNTNPSSSQTYLYGNASFPFAMTGITDEDGNQFATWTYDSSGRATSSQHGTGADLTTVVYNSDGTTTVANALGVADTYTFQTLQGVPKVTQISRAATSTTGAATEIFTYDNNGYMASKTDWNGNRTTYVNDAHGDPTTINEAVGTGAARTTAIAYDSTWVHLPASVTTSGVTTTYTYDSSGEQLTRTLTDTTISTAPYSTSGQARTWTNKWSNYLLGSVKTPNGNTTKYTFDGSGALTSITDAKGHVTNITSHTGGGYPTTIVDPNNVTTTLTYDPRLRLTSSTVSGTEGTYKASWSYDAAGNLITTTLPDNSFLTNAYDTAHRLTKVTDALGNYTGYTLDALGDRTQTNIYSASGTVTWRRSGTFDALGRLLIDTAGAGQTTTRTFDPNGNVLTVTDGLNYTTTNTYDALNRLSTSTDANSGVTTPAYDAHDRIVSVTDANGNTTGYTRDGFGDVIQQTSPDSGVTVYSYDGDANLTSKTDARGIVTNQTFDALDRPLTTTYPADGSENVAYTYDQTGSGFAFGIGRLTSVTDAAGSLTRQYEERGNLANETRVNGTTTLFTSYTYDGASRIASITYPDGTLVSYQRDAAGYVSKVTAQLPGATSGTTIATMTHLPFGPVNSASYGNGVAENWTYDNDYRATNIADALSGTGLQNLRYAYDNANNVSSITDAVNPANSQTLGYDVINRLINAASGSGGYGGFTWTYDKVGNRLTEVQGSTATTYGYTPGTNRLTTITMGTTTASLKIPTQIKRVHNSPGSMLNARMPNSSISTPRSAGRHNPARQASPALSAILGWPMILAGFTVIAGFRKRLLKSRWLALLPLALVLTGASKILSGCGGGGTSTQLNPTTTTATPTFSPAAGTYSAAQTVTISDSTSGAAIYYTTDGSTPTANSTKYSGPITVSSTETIQAIAVATGSTSSAVATATYTISASQQTATPVFSPPGGSYTSAQSVTISDATPGTTIYYTTDGSTPTASSTAYTGPITVSATETIKAIAVASGYANSAVATATYTISAEQQAATPTFGPAGGTYTSAQNVAIFDATTGATIYYTTDGSTPTTSSTAYSGSITVSATETIKAIAAASGYSNSAVATATYTINILPPADIPTFSPGGGTYTSAQSVTISDATTGATIYYTDNLSIPTNNWPIYTGPITVNTTEILAAYAVAPGYAASSIKEADFTITLLPQAAAPTFSPAGGAYTSAQSVTIPMRRQVRRSTIRPMARRRRRVLPNTAEPSPFLLPRQSRPSRRQAATRTATSRPRATPSTCRLRFRFPPAPTATSPAFRSV